ncbi:hypothetical protein ABC337_11500 [Arthrobacter sp. 1P04PC]
MRARTVQRAAHAAFWTLATCVVYIFLAVPPTLARLIFGSPS